MEIYLNDSKIQIDSEDYNKELILKEIQEKLDDEIINKIYLDDVDVSIDYFIDNNIRIEKLDKISFETKKTKNLIEETLQQTKQYYPNLKESLGNTAELYKIGSIGRASNRLDKCLTGLEWYLEEMHGIFSLIEKNSIAEKGKTQLENLNKSNNRAMLALQNENYDYLAETIEHDILPYLEKIDELNYKLLEE